MTVRKHYAIVWALIDAVVAAVAYIIATATITRTASQLNNTSLIFSIVFITLASCYVSRVYHQIWEQTSGHGIVILMRGLIMAALITGLMTIFMPGIGLTASHIIIGHALIFGGMTFIRYRSRLLSGLNWRWDAVWHRQFPANHTRILIIGAGESGEMLARKMRYQQTPTFSDDSQKPLTYQVVGFVDDAQNKQGLSVEGYRVLGTREDIPRLVEQYDVDMIVVAIHNIKGSAFRDILTYCERATAQVKIVPDTVGALGHTAPHRSLRDIQPEDLIGRTQISRDDRINLEPVTRKAVLITGAAGSIGSELSRQMATYRPSRLCLLDNNESALHDLHIELKQQYPHLDLVPILADVTDADHIESIFEAERPQVVYHAAAYKHVPMLEHYPNQAVRVNIGGTRLIAEQAGRNGAERFVLISTDKAVKPSSIMGATKRLCELIIQDIASKGYYPTRYTAVRFGNVLGSRGSVVPTFTSQLDNGGPITITDFRMTRYFMSIPEAVNLVIHAACLTQGNDLFVLRMGETVRILDIAERMIRIRGLRPHIDVEIVETGIRPGEKLHEELYDDDEQPQDTEHPYIFKLSNHHQLAHFEDRLMEIMETDLNQLDDPLAALLHVNEPFAAVSIV